MMYVKIKKHPLILFVRKPLKLFLLLSSFHSVLGHVHYQHCGCVVIFFTNFCKLPCLIVVWVRHTIFFFGNDIVFFGHDIVFSNIVLGALYN